MAKFKVWNPDWEDEEEGLDIDCFDAAWAVKEYCKEVDALGHFCDGYPKSEIFHARDETGRLRKVSVDTDWTPNFYCVEQDTP